MQIKLKFLDENRVKVMQKQLLLFHSAVGAYFSGNQTALESMMKQFLIKVSLPQSFSASRPFYQLIFQVKSPNSHPAA